MITPIDIAQKAKEMVDDEVVQHILNHLEGKYIHEWKISPLGDIQKREAAYAGVRALEDFRTRLNSMALAPRVEAHNNRHAVKR